MVKSLILCHYFFNLSDAKGLPPPATLNPRVYIPGRFPGLVLELEYLLYFYL